MQFATLLISKCPLQMAIDSLRFTGERWNRGTTRFYNKFLQLVKVFLEEPSLSRAKVFLYSKSNPPRKISNTV